MEEPSKQYTVPVGHRLDWAYNYEDKCYMTTTAFYASKLLFWVWVGFVGVVLWAVRTRLKEIYQIHESNLETAACSFCCPYCSLCQMMQHVYSYSITGGSPCTFSPTGDPEDVDLRVVHGPRASHSAVPVGLPVAPVPVDARAGKQSPVLP